MSDAAQPPASVRSPSPPREMRSLELGAVDLVRPVGACFAAIAARDPHAPAVKTSRGVVTYGELDRVSNRLARAVGSGTEPVALLFEDGISFVAASLGVLKAGRIQVAFEPTVPPAELAVRLRHSGAKLILADTRRLPFARELAKAAARVLDADRLGAEGSAAPLDLGVTTDTAAVIEYTSGSTGEPKGILRTHGAIVHDVWRHQQVARVSPGDRLLIPRLTILAQLRALLTGALFYPVTLRAETFAGVAAWMIQERITVYRSAVSAFRSVANVLAPDDRFADLRMVVLYGEPIHRSDVDLVRRRTGPGCTLVGTLGAAEFGDYAYFVVERDTLIPGDVVPGGYAADDVEVLLLDADGGPAEPRDTGELAVRSRHVAIGYWNRPDLTAAAFLDDPDGGDRRTYRTGDLGRRGPDGCLFHLGRKDLQVKVSGHRVALPAVETALRAVNGVKDAAVIAHRDAAGHNRLVAYVVSDGGAAIRPDLRRELASRLMPHLIPTRFVAMESLPLTPSGKIDRGALPAPSVTRPDIGTPFVPARSPLEAEITEIWATVLGLDAVGIHDHFLDLGGSSLLATQVVAAVLARLTIEVPLDHLLTSGTVAEMAAAVLGGLVQARGANDVASRLAEMAGEGPS